MPRRSRARGTSGSSRTSGRGRPGRRSTSNGPSRRWSRFWRARRIWFLSRELAKLAGLRLGGNLPDDWWGYGGEPFATYAAGLALARLGHADVAQWVRSMHRANPGYEFLWQIRERCGAGWAARFFRLLREGRIDFASFPEGAGALRIRSLYLIAYLSIACEENLAEQCAAAGFGGKPADWDSRKPGVPFREYRITADKVDGLIALRARLFEDGREDPGLSKEREKFLRGEAGR